MDQQKQLGVLTFLPDNKEHKQEQHEIHHQAYTKGTASTNTSKEETWNESE